MAGHQAEAQDALKKSKPKDEPFSQDPDKVFNEYPGMLYHSNLLVVAKKYTNKQIAERDTKIRQQNDSQEVVDTNLIVHRIKSACKHIAKQKGISLGAFRREFALQRPQSESGQIPFSLRSFQAVQIPSDPKSFEDLDQCRKELKKQGYPLEFDVKIYLVCQKFMKDNNKSFREAVDEVCRVYGFKNRNSAVNLLKDAESRALDREGNIVDWKVDNGLVEGDKKSKSLEFLAKIEARARDANAKASPGPTRVAALPSGSRSKAPRALNSSRKAAQTPVQDLKTQSRPMNFGLAASTGVLDRPFPPMGLISHPDSRPPPTSLQQNAPFWAQPTFPHTQDHAIISGIPQSYPVSYTYPEHFVDARPHYQSLAQQTASLQEQGTQTNGYAPTGGFYYGNWHTTFAAAAIPTAIPTAITTANYAAAQPASNFRRHEAHPISATPTRIPDVPTYNGAIVSPSALPVSSSEDVQLRNAPATLIGRVLPEKVINNKKKKLNDPLRSRLHLFLKVLDDPNHIHHEEFDLNTFAHIITVGEADDLQETVEDIIDFHNHLETKTGHLRSKYTDEQIRKATAKAVRHFIDSEYQKGAYFIDFFLNVLAKFDELVEPAPAQGKEIQEAADAMDIDKADEVDVGEDGSGGADEQKEDAVGGDGGADLMEID